MISKYKIGFGFDSHRFGKGKKLVIGGVEIPCGKGFVAHSDGDVLIHSVIDAILGASGKGNIGERYPDSDNKYKNISSVELLSDTYKLIKTEYSVVNIDCTVILEEPNIRRYVDKMRETISKILNISTRQINVKGKTSEGMGFAGKGEGAAAFSVILLERIV